MERKAEIALTSETGKNTFRREKQSLNVNPSLGRKQTTGVDGNKLNSYEEREVAERVASSSSGKKEEKVVECCGGEKRVRRVGNNLGYLFPLCKLPHHIHS
ncbi:CLUMA_CG019698, isoform A [Clunio marinus]|uniref:CLUMA_CG019698, isoform A n=1 Tax=Clunio marinus TaxID=568069 RepID=A0A1J1J2R0_9DIPT|nr:CLUMA_CG019698, isoform A [Clunio marinus]